MQFLSVSRRRLDVFPVETWTPELLESESQRVREMTPRGRCARSGGAAICPAR
jgi:hypothetical protein